MSKELIKIKEILSHSFDKMFTFLEFKKNYKKFRNECFSLYKGEFSSLNIPPTEIELWDFYNFYQVILKKNKELNDRTLYKIYIIFIKFDTDFKNKFSSNLHSNERYIKNQIISILYKYEIVAKQKFISWADFGNQWQYKNIPDGTNLRSILIKIKKINNEVKFLSIKELESINYSLSLVDFRNFASHSVSLFSIWARISDDVFLPHENKKDLEKIFIISKYIIEQIDFILLNKNELTNFMINIFFTLKDLYVKEFNSFINDSIKSIPEIKMNIIPEEYIHEFEYIKILLIETKKSLMKINN